MKRNDVLLIHVLLLLMTGCTVIDSRREVVRTDKGVVEVDIMKDHSITQQDALLSNMSFEKTVVDHNGYTSISGEGLVLGADGGYRVVTDIRRISNNHFEVVIESREPFIELGGTTMAMVEFPYQIEANLSEPFRLDVYEAGSRGNSTDRIVRGIE